MIILWIILTILAIWSLCVLNSFQIEKARRERIYQKYGRNEISEKIIKKIVWVGETKEQLRDSLGMPCDIDENVLKTKVKEIWKYYRKSANRYGFKVKVENGAVVGWDEKL